MVSKDRGWQNKCNLFHYSSSDSFRHFTICMAESGELVSSLSVQCCAMLATRLNIQPVLLDILYILLYIATLDCMIIL